MLNIKVSMGICLYQMIHFLLVSIIAQGCQIQDGKPLEIGGLSLERPQGVQHHEVYPPKHNFFPRDLISVVRRVSCNSWGSPQGAPEDSHPQGVYIGRIQDIGSTLKKCHFQFHKKDQASLVKISIHLVTSLYFCNHSACLQRLQPVFSE